MFLIKQGSCKEHKCHLLKWATQNLVTGHKQWTDPPHPPKSVSFHLKMWWSTDLGAHMKRQFLENQGKWEAEFMFYTIMHMGLSRPNEQELFS